MSAAEATARAKEIAARLAGTSASASIAPDPAPDAFNVNDVADAALAAAFGQSSESSAGGNKRKRWGDNSGGSGVGKETFLLKSLIFSFIFNIFISYIHGKPTLFQYSIFGRSSIGFR